MGAFWLNSTYAPNWGYGNNLMGAGGAFVAVVKAGDSRADGSMHMVERAPNQSITD